MMMKRILLFLVMCWGLQTKGQPPVKFYTKFGGQGIDIGYSLKQTLDRQFIIAGSTSSYGAGSTDILLAKLDSMGQLKWLKTLGGFGNDIARSIIQLADSGFIIAGFTNSYGNGGYDALLIKTDKNGNQLWLKTFGGLDWDFGYDVIEMADGNLVMCGSTNSFGGGKMDGFIAKYSQAGNLLMQKYFGGAEDDDLRGIYTRNGSEMFVAGVTRSHGDIDGDMLVYKLDNNGDSLLRIIYGGPDIDYATDVCVMFNGEIVVGGATKNFSANAQDAMAVKFSSVGTFMARDKYGNNNDQEIYKVIESNSGFGSVVVLYSDDESQGTKVDIITKALDADLQFLMGGNNGSFGLSDEDVAYDICPTRDKGYAQVGYTRSLNAQDQDVFFVKRDSMMRYGAVVIGLAEHHESSGGAVLYPNPVTNKINIKFKQQNHSSQNEVSIFSLTGELVLKREANFSHGHFQLSTESLAPGVYYVHLKNEEVVFHFKILKL